MKNLILSLFFLLNFSVVFPQAFEIKQITSGDFDAKNPSISSASFWEGRVYYEKHEVNSSNIILIKYDADANSFQDTVELTSGSAMRINPYEDFNLNVVYQTNENGNWDIVYKLYNNGAWDSTIYLENSSADETNLSPFYSSDFGFPNDNFILFERSDTIIVLEYTNSIKTEYPVLVNSSQYNYSDYVGVYYYNTVGYYPRPGIHVIAVETDSSGKKNLISKYKPVSGGWDIKNIIKENCKCRNPELQFYSYIPHLTFEDSTSSGIRPFAVYDWEYEKEIDSIPDLLNGNISNFKVNRPDIITSNPFNPVEIEYLPHSYFLKNEDGLQIRLNKQELGSVVGDTLINVKYDLSKMSLGALGFNLDEVFYTIWEDSSDGHIHLFGRRQLYPIDYISEENTINRFFLKQNYPNPFNPTTTIQYEINSRQFVTLKVYDVLGKEIGTLVNEEKSTGEYEVEFDATGLSSGVYFYQLRVGDPETSSGRGIIQTKKMLMIK
ncbi:MAG: T9SS type A sorting domain-containing protein [Ignavibacteriaceae bacterium]|jgi:hypothetical protein|nr:T9SS type A sorting domain-containing protein [Ignavibacteriaceae bacterium]MCW8813372.1 T9SS type A sorting domain-containing protein [Chlorobium sp.]MCW8961234.1 T9SS type A sorting domain-containing protein [Ignavibacteriaceae bacterium]MCW9097226.1 T9SS type A sorting domain-containing protein [Ignavibacteriaceae bacterium]